MRRAPIRPTRSRGVRAMGRPVAITVMLMILGAGCASFRQSVSGWFGETPPPETPVPSEEQTSAKTSVPAGEKQTYYAGVEGLTVYAEASASSKVVGHLTLYQKVSRSQMQRGYAYVAADAGGLEGWVDNGKLLWRLPATPSGERPAAGAAAVAGENVPTPEGGPAVESTTPSTPEAEASAVVVPPTSTPAPETAAAPTPQSSRARAQPNMFDPY